MPQPHAHTHAPSLLGREWALRDADEGIIRAITQHHGVSEIVARMLASRGVDTNEVADFLNPTLRTFLPDPFHLLDMQKAANRLADAVVKQETIGIFGDYDVDGATSSALFIKFFSALGIHALVHIPDRMMEGYGPNAPALLKLKDRGASVVITVDCGTLAFEPLKAAKDAGLDVIVCDHHQGEAKLPECFAVINPNRLDEASEHRHLAAVGMTFLLVVATNRVLRERGFYTNHPEPDLMQWLDLVALGTICDVVPLKGVNRALVTQGLKMLAARGNTGLRALADVARLSETPGAYHAGFVLGPRINAGGRVGQSDLGVRLLTTDDEGEALLLAQTLDMHNRERQAIEAAVLEEAFAMAEAERMHSPFLLLAREGWHPGVIGIVAGRIKDHYRCPVAVVAMDGSTGKASARSVSGFDIGAAIVAAVQQGLLVQGGGHKMAAGFTMEAGKTDALRQFLCTRYTEDGDFDRPHEFLLDGYVTAGAIMPSLIEQIERAGPFGAGNPTPRFAVPSLRAVHASVVGKDHVRVMLSDGDAKLSAIAFRAVETKLGEFLLSPKARAVPFTAAGTLKLNVWQGNTRAELHIDDASVHA